MATVIGHEERDGHKIAIYESGAEYDLTAGHLVRPASNNLITAENAIALNRRRQELARAELIAGANEAVEELNPKIAAQAMQGDLAYVRAIGYATATKAQNPKDPKQTDASRLLLTIGEQLGQAQQQELDNQQAQPRLYLLVAQLHERKGDVVEGMVTETDITVSKDGAHSSDKDEKK